MRGGRLHSPRLLRCGNLLLRTVCPALRCEAKSVVAGRGAAGVVKSAAPDGDNAGACAILRRHAGVSLSSSAAYDTRLFSRGSPMPRFRHCAGASAVPFFKRPSVGPPLEFDQGAS